MWISVCAIGYFISIGLNLPLTPEEMAEILFIIITSLIIKVILTHIIKKKIRFKIK